MARRHRGPSMRALHWDEAKHPRDDRGRFAHKGGGRWLGKALKQVEARFGDIGMGAAPGSEPRGRLQTGKGGLIDTKAISRGAPRIESRTPLGPAEAPGGRTARTATGVKAAVATATPPVGGHTAPPRVARLASGVDKSRVSTQANGMSTTPNIDTRRAGADATGKERSALARTAGGVMSPEAAARHNAAATSLQEDRTGPTPEQLAARLRRHGLEKIAKDVEAGRYRKAEDALHRETTSGRLSRATFEKRNDARAVYNDLTRMQEPQNAEDFGGRTVVKSGSGWAVRGNEEDRKALGGAYLYTTKTKADAEDWARTHTAAQRAMREGRHEDAARINREREAALVGGEGRAYRPQGSVAMVPADKAQERAAALRAETARRGAPNADGANTEPGNATPEGLRTNRQLDTLRRNEFGFPQAEGPARPPVSHEQRRAASLATRDGIPPKDGRPDITMLAASNSKNDYHRWSLSTSEGRDPTMAPDVARVSGGVLDGKAVSAVVMNPKDGTGDYRYRIVEDGTGQVLEEGSGHDAGEVFAKADRIFSSQRGGGMARTAGNEVHYVARSQERPKDVSRGDWGMGPFYDFTVNEVDRNGNERTVVKTNSMDRAHAQAAAMNAKEEGATERAAAALAESRRHSMADIYNRHRDVTRAQFDAMSPDEQQRVLNDLRKVRDSKEQVSHTIPGNRTSMGTTIRGTKNAPHVDAAQAKLRELTYTAPPPPDNSIEAQRARLARGFASGSKEQLNQASIDAGLGGIPTSWKLDKMRDYLRARANAGDLYDQAFPDGRFSAETLGQALSQAGSREQAAGLLDAIDLLHGLTTANMQAAAATLGGTLRGSKRKHRDDLIELAAGRRADSAAIGRQAAGPTGRTASGVVGAPGSGFTEPPAAPEAPAAPTRTRKTPLERLEAQRETLRGRRDMAKERRISSRNSRIQSANESKLNNQIAALDAQIATERENQRVTTARNAMGPTAAPAPSASPAGELIAGYPRLVNVSSGSPRPPDIKFKSVKVSNLWDGAVLVRSNQSVKEDGSHIGGIVDHVDWSGRSPVIHFKDGTSRRVSRDGMVAVGQRYGKNAGFLTADDIKTPMNQRASVARNAMGPPAVPSTTPNAEGGNFAAELRAGLGAGDQLARQTALRTSVASNAQERQLRDQAEVVNRRLRDVGTREEAQAELAGMTVEQLRELARMLNVRRDGATKQDLKDRIVERTVGNRLNAGVLGDPESLRTRASHVPAPGSASSGHVELENLNQGDHVRVSGVDQYGHPTSLNGYVQGKPGQVTMRKGRTRKPMYAVQVSDTPSGGGANFRGVVYVEPGQLAERTEPGTGDVGPKGEARVGRTASGLTRVDTPSVNRQTGGMTATMPYNVGQRVEVLAHNFSKPGMPREWKPGTVTSVERQENGRHDVMVTADDGTRHPQIVGVRGGNNSLRSVQESSGNTTATNVEAIDRVIGHLEATQATRAATDLRGIRQRATQPGTSAADTAAEIRIVAKGSPTDIKQALNGLARQLERNGGEAVTRQDATARVDAQEAEFLRSLSEPFLASTVSEARFKRLLASGQIRPTGSEYRGEPLYEAVTPTTASPKVSSLRSGRNKWVGAEALAPASAANTPTTRNIGPMPKATSYAKGREVRPGMLINAADLLPMHESQGNTTGENPNPRGHAAWIRVGLVGNTNNPEYKSYNSNRSLTGGMYVVFDQSGHPVGRMSANTIAEINDADVRPEAELQHLRTPVKLRIPLKDPRTGETTIEVRDGFEMTLVPSRFAQQEAGMPAPRMLSEGIVHPEDPHYGPRGTRPQPLYRPFGERVQGNRTREQAAVERQRRAEVYAAGEPERAARRAEEEARRKADAAAQREADRIAGEAKAAQFREQYRRDQITRRHASVVEDLADTNPMIYDPSIGTTRPATPEEFAVHELERSSSDLKWLASAYGLKTRGTSVQQQAEAIVAAVKAGKTPDLEVDAPKVLDESAQAEADAKKIATLDKRRRTGIVKNIEEIRSDLAHGFGTARGNERSFHLSFLSDAQVQHLADAFGITGLTGRALRDAIIAAIEAGQTPELDANPIISLKKKR